MKKKILSILAMSLSAIVLLLVVGCSAEELSTEKLRDIDFTVVDEEDIPEELGEMIEKNENQAFKLTYADKGELYIAVGYGEQPTTGYSIQVKELYESKNAIYIHTDLIGPTKDEKILERATHPYIVVKLEYIDKNVVFK